MKTSWGKSVHVIPFIRTLLIVLAVAVCTVAAQVPETLRKNAEAGDAEAQFRLGWSYDSGSIYNSSGRTHCPMDPAKALMWFRKAANQDHP